MMLPSPEQVDTFCHKHVDRIETLNLILDQISEDPDPTAVTCFLLYMWVAVNKRWPNSATLNATLDPLNQNAAPAASLN